MDLRAVRGKKEGTYVDVSVWGGDEAQPGGRDGGWSKGEMKWEEGA